MVAKKSLVDLNCSLAQALEIVGDWWTLLILRDAFMGCRRFGEFETSLPISKNILARRLASLVEAGMLDRSSGSRRGYEPTEKSYDLLPAMLALLQWGDRWTGDRKPPMVAVSHRGTEIAKIELLDRDAMPVQPTEVRFVPGPGATDATRELLAKISANRTGDASPQAEAAASFLR